MLCPGQGLLQQDVVPAVPELALALGGVSLWPEHHRTVPFLLHSRSACFLGPLLGLAGSPIYAMRSMAAKALVPVVPPPQRRGLLLQLARQLPTAPGRVRSHNAVHGHLLQMRALLAPAPGTDG